MSTWGADELYVTNVPSSAAPAEISALFAQHGVVKEYVVVSKKADHKATQAGLVRMASHADALAAKKAVNRMEFKNRTLNVKWSHSQRVLWVGRLYESVTNEVLNSAFSQFGLVQRAVVALDVNNNVSKRYGFVVFENKRDAQKAMQKCSEQPFIIGQTAKPVKVEWAWIEDIDQGYPEEARSGNRKVQVSDFNSAVVSHFVSPGSKEYGQAARLAELDAEYQHVKTIMKLKLTELENQLMVTGQAPTLASALSTDPGFAAAAAAAAVPQPQQQSLMMAAAPRPLPAGLPPPMAPVAHGSMGLPPPMQAPTVPGGVAGYAAAPPGILPPAMGKRNNEDFHHVPPPSKKAMKSHDRNFERFTPVAGPPPAGPQPPPGPPPGSGFVRGGELHTVDDAQSSASPVTGNGHAASVQAIQAGADQPSSQSILTSAKVPGKVDHRGLGFTGTESAQDTLRTSSTQLATPHPPPYPPPTPGAVAATAQQPQPYSYAMSTPPTQQQPQQQQQQQYAYPPPPHNVSTQPHAQQQYTQQPAQQYAPQPPQQAQQYTQQYTQSPYAQTQYSQQPQQYQAVAQPPQQLPSQQPAPMQQHPAAQQPQSLYMGAPQAGYAAPQPAAASYPPPLQAAAPPPVSGYTAVQQPQQQYAAAAAAAPQYQQAQAVYQQPSMQYYA